MMKFRTSFEEFPYFPGDMSHNFTDGSLLSPRVQAHAVTLPEFTGGEFLPLPAHPRWVPTASATSVGDSRTPQK